MKAYGVLKYSLIALLFYFSSGEAQAGKVSLSRLRQVVTANPWDSEAFFPSTVARYRRMVQTGRISGQNRGANEINIHPSLFGIGFQSAYELAEHRAKGMASREFFYAKLGLKNPRHITPALAVAHQQARGIVDNILTLRRDAALYPADAVRETLEIYDVQLEKVLTHRILSNPRIKKFGASLPEARAAVEKSIHEKGVVVGLRGIFSDVLDGKFSMRTHPLLNFDELIIDVRNLPNNGRKLSGLPFSYIHSVSPIGDRSWLELTLPIGLSRLGRPLL